MTYSPKSLIEQAVANAQVTRPCPCCSMTPGLGDTSANQMGPGNNGVHKRGRWRGIHRNSMPLCQFCKGLKVVYLNRICECGMPGVCFDSTRKVWYCGSEPCAQHAAYRLNVLNVRTYPPQHGPDSWAEMSGP